mgnify:CR=1 FL=1
MSIFTRTSKGESFLSEEVVEELKIRDRRVLLTDIDTKHYYEIICYLEAFLREENEIEIEDKQKYFSFTFDLHQQLHYFEYNLLNRRPKLLVKTGPFVFEYLLDKGQLPKIRKLFIRIISQYLKERKETACS